MDEDQVRDALRQLGSAAGGLLNGVRLLLRAWENGEQQLATDVASQLMGAASALAQLEGTLGMSFGILF